MSNKLQTTGDKLAVSLSFICALHCLLFPIIAVFLPATLALAIGSEVFHLAMIIGVLPISIYSLNLGCKTHKVSRIKHIGYAGLAFLVVALLWESVAHAAGVAQGYGEAVEKTLTVTGTILIAIAHIKNFRQCQRVKHGCHS